VLIQSFPRPSVTTFANTFNRVDDDAALKAKVDEALTVYDEYVKNKGGEAEGGEAPTKEPATESTEGVQS
jgi:polyadenylate-binding protein